MYSSCSAGWRTAVFMAQSSLWLKIADSCFLDSSSMVFHNDFLVGLIFCSYKVVPKDGALLPRPLQMLAMVLFCSRWRREDIIRRQCMLTKNRPVEELLRTEGWQNVDSLILRSLQVTHAWDCLILELKRTQKLKISRFHFMSK